MILTPRPWREPAASRRAPSTENAAPVAMLPTDIDLAALIANDDTLLATVQEQARARGLYVVHNGREIKVSPIIEPGWRVIVENHKQRQAA